MKSYEINNFVGASPLLVKVAATGLYVNVMCYAGSLQLQHTMTAAQAREMAAALIEFADALDGVAA